MTTRLIIKGTLLEAATAAAERNVSLVGVSTKLGLRDEVLAQTNSDLILVAGWFAEPGEAPFPQGTLLTFSVKDKDT